MARTRRILRRGGSDTFEEDGQIWYQTTFVNFSDLKYVEVPLGFTMNLNGTQVTQVVIWEDGFISFGTPTQAQIDWVNVNAGTGNLADFPGDYIAVGYAAIENGLNFTFGEIDFEPPYIDAEKVPIMRIDWSSPDFDEMQLQLNPNDFTIVDTRVSSPGSTPGQVGFRIGNEVFNGTSDYIPDYVLGDGLIGVFEGDVEANLLLGSWRPDLILGAGGDDRIDGRGGADEMRGGLGNDSYVVTAGDAVYEYHNQGIDTVRSWATFQLKSNVENLFLIGTAATNGTGNNLANRIVGNAADNRIDGAGGIDRMEGRGGNDIYRIETRGDYAVEAAAGGIDAVHSKITIGLHANVENLLLLDGAANGFGNGLSNAITGNGAANQLDGRGGADQMRGRGGNDTYFVDDVLDRAIELAGQGADRVVSRVTFTLEAEVERLQLAGSDEIGGTGNAGANSIIGNAAANALNGKAGDDWLYGRLGNDLLTGEAGRDRFVFDTALDGALNVDEIADFSVADDVIVLRHSVFSVDTGRLSADAFVNGDTAIDAEDRILYHSATGNIFYDADGSGNGAAILFARVDPGTALTNADFVGF